MAGQQLYVIDYELQGENRTFIIRLEHMDNAEAWHWASCDAGVGVIPRFGQHKIKKSQPADGRALRHCQRAVAGVGQRGGIQAAAGGYLEVFGL